MADGGPLRVVVIGAGQIGHADMVPHTPSAKEAGSRSRSTTKEPQPPYSLDRTTARKPRPVTPPSR